MENKFNWRRVNNFKGRTPKPRHGHRAVAIAEYMIIFGGGNEEIVDDLDVYNSLTNEWFSPVLQGDLPPGCAAYGIAVDGTRILIFGGMLEFGRYSNQLYELETRTWEWRRLSPGAMENVPSPRIGHNFTISGNKVYVFGGLVQTPRGTRYVNDFYALELRPDNTVAWEKPVTYGTQPSPRESHTVVSYTDSYGNPMLLLFGGMCGSRLGDLWIFSINSMTWLEAQVSGSRPLPRSLHTASIVGDKMIVFGGWVPTLSPEHEWKCSNNLACLNLANFKWEEIEVGGEPPKGRAGHSSIVISGRLYIWSGRDGYRKAWNNQVCCKDLWYLEVEPPRSVPKLKITKATTNSLLVNWDPVASAERYLLELYKEPSPDMTYHTLLPERKVSFLPSFKSELADPLKFPQIPLSPSKSYNFNTTANEKSTGYSNILRHLYSNNKTETDNGNSEENNMLDGTPGFTTDANNLQVPHNLFLPPQIPNYFSGETPDRILLNKISHILSEIDPSLKKNKTVDIGKLKNENNCNARNNTQNEIVSNDCCPRYDDNITVLSAWPAVKTNGSKLKPIVATKMEGFDNSNSSDILNSSNGVGKAITIVVPKTGAKKTLNILGKTTLVGPANTRQPKIFQMCDNKTAPSLNLNKIMEAQNSSPCNKYLETNNNGTNVVQEKSSDISNYLINFNPQTMLLHSQSSGLDPLQNIQGTKKNKNCTRDLGSKSNNAIDNQNNLEVGVPGTPVSVKILRGREGARLSWSPPKDNKVVSSYSVCMAVKNKSSPSQAVCFIRVYLGSKNEATISNTLLEEAYIDPTAPAVMFRIAAKNSYGFGPAIQVRWMVTSGDLVSLHRKKSLPLLGPSPKKRCVD